MRFNWIDLLTIGIVATVGGVQLLRGAKSFSRVLYETLLLIAALIGATALYEPVQAVLGVSRIVAYLVLFVVLATLAMLAGAGLQRLVPFGLGIFGHIFSLLNGVACGWVVGHAVLRSLTGISSPQLHLAIRRSWMASQVLNFGAWIELMALLRLARWHRL